MRFAMTLFLAFTMIACSKNKPVQAVDTNKKGGSVGPFDLALSGESEEKSNTFSVQINQPDGAVDFYVANGDAVQYLYLKNYSSSVVGCDAAKVEVFPLWYPSEGAEVYDILAQGKTMMTTPRTRSKLRVVFRGLEGCSTLNFAMVVKKLDVGPLQMSVEEKLRGIWDFNTGVNEFIRFDISPSRTNWMEYKGGRYTCDTYASPLNSVAADGGWLVFDRGNLLCRYKFAAGSSTVMDVTCLGTPTFGCTLPSQFRFTRN